MERDILEAIILAAGRGRRLHPITTSRTKAMAPIIGKPILERVMEPLVIHGIRSFVIVFSPEDQDIIEYFHSNSTIEAKVTLVPQPDPLGMGHALLQAAPFITDNFILSACDNLVETVEIGSILNYWNEQVPDALLTSIQVANEDISRMGILQINEDKVIRIIEKPKPEEVDSNIGSIPLYIFSREILELLRNIPISARGEYELQDAIQLLIDRDGDVRTIELSGRKDLTKPEDLLNINLDYLKKSFISEIKTRGKIGRNTQLIPPYFVEESVNIGSNCHIGPNVYIEHGSRILDEVHLENVVVLRNRTIPTGIKVKQRLIF